MSHLDPERLALIAVEGTTTDAERGHLAACDVCALELAELEHTVVVGKATVALGDLEAPPERVWGRILEDVRAEAGVPAEPAAAPKRPRSRRLLWSLAASVAAVLAVVGVWSLVRAQAPVEVAAATLAAFPDHPDATGEAVVTRSPGGEQTVTVTLVDASDPDGFREVWLITADASALISLGELDGTEGTFVVPDGIDLRDYVLVDVSQEPRDGDPAHSGDSIVRGELDFS